MRINCKNRHTWPEFVNFAHAILCAIVSKVHVLSTIAGLKKKKNLDSETPLPCSPVHIFHQQIFTVKLYLLIFTYYYYISYMFI